VLNLFLPIVVFLFGLWWMLALKFCIPPSFSFGAGGAARVALAGNLDLAIQAELDAGAAMNATRAARLAAAKVNLLTRGDAGFNGNYAAPNAPAAGSPGARVVADFGDEGTADLGVKVGNPQQLPPLTSLPRVPRVRREEVFA
jgi:hypothetical protein